MDRTNRLTDWLTQNRDLAFEAIRIYLGLGLFAKGVYFVGHADVVSSLARNGGFDLLGFALGHLVALAHLGGGLLLAAGLLTRLAALIQVPVLVGAVFFVHLREGVFGPTQNLEFSALTLALLVLAALAGGGRWSADFYLERTAAPAPQPVAALTRVR